MLRWMGRDVPRVQNVSIIRDTQLSQIKSPDGAGLAGLLSKKFSYRPLLPACIVPKEEMSKFYWKVAPPLRVEKEAGLVLLNMSSGFGFWATGTGSGTGRVKEGCWAKTWFWEAELVWKSNCIVLKSSGLGWGSALLGWNCAPKLSWEGLVGRGSGCGKEKLVLLLKLVVSNMCLIVLKSLAPLGCGWNWGWLMGEEKACSIWAQLVSTGFFAKDGSCFTLPIEKSRSPRPKLLLLVEVEKALGLS